MESLAESERRKRSQSSQGKPSMSMRGSKFVHDATRTHYRESDIQGSSQLTQVWEVISGAGGKIENSSQVS